MKTLAAVLMIALVGCKQAEPPKEGDLYYADPQMGRTASACPDDMQTILPSRREERQKDAIYHIVLCQRGLSRKGISLVMQHKC